MARRRLVGFEQHAEDVVQRALIKWQGISRTKAGSARIEQVVKTEALSILRSTHRTMARDTRVVTDPSSNIGRSHSEQREREQVELTRALIETCKNERITVRRPDVEVLELLLAGYRTAEIVRSTALSRHTVRTSKRLWQRVVELTISASEQAK